MHDDTEVAIKTANIHMPIRLIIFVFLLFFMSINLFLKNKMIYTHKKSAEQLVISHFEVFGVTQVDE